METMLNKINEVIKRYCIPETWKIDVDILDEDTIAINGVGFVKDLSTSNARDSFIDRIGNEVINELGDEYSRDELTWYLESGAMINDGVEVVFNKEIRPFDIEKDFELVHTVQVLIMK